MTFNWNDFWHTFPYAEFSRDEAPHEREGDYLKRMMSILDTLSVQERITLLDLVDIQIVSYIEQMCIISASNLVPSLEGPLHFASARLQISENLRMDYGLPQRGISAGLLRLKPGSLLQMIEAHAHDPLS